MAHRLQIFCLGSPRILLDGQDITLKFQTNAARGLLVYLCLNKDKIHSRNVLANLLWPDLPPTRSLKTFSQTLNRTRSALEDRNAEEPMILIYGQKNIELNPAYEYWLDIDEFTQYLQSCESHRHRHLKNCPICLEWLQHAASLYQADFLAGFELSSVLYSAWASGQSHIFHRQAMDLFYTLTQSYEYLGNYKNAQIFARRQLILEPWNEEAHCQLMQNYALDGKRSAALAQYHECCQVLQEEFDVKPSKSTNQLYIDICNEVPCTQSESTSTFSNLPPSLGAFVGRKRELNQLLHLLLDPTNHLVTITGLGGAGKTHLAIAAAEKATTSFMNGVIFVDLSQILPENRETYTAELFTAAVAHTFREVEEMWNTFCSALDHMSPMSALLDCFADKELLLVLDDFEQCPALADCVWQIITHTTNVVVLITSRYPVDIYGEKIFPLHGLTYPSDELTDDNSTCAPETLLEKYESIQLLTLRAVDRGTNLVLNRQNMQAIIEICQLVDGSPLALEMAASKIYRYSVREIADQIYINLDFLQIKFIGIAQRHCSIKAILLDAWRRLTQDECAILLRLVSDLSDTPYFSPKQLDSLEKLTMYTLVYQNKQGVYKIPHLIYQFIVTNPLVAYHRTI